MLFSIAYSVKNQMLNIKASVLFKNPPVTCTRLIIVTAGNFICANASTPNSPSRIRYNTANTPPENPTAFSAALICFLSSDTYSFKKSTIDTME